MFSCIVKHLNIAVYFLNVYLIQSEWYNSPSVTQLADWFISDFFIWRVMEASSIPRLSTPRDVLWEWALKRIEMENSQRMSIQDGMKEVIRMSPTSRNPLRLSRGSCVVTHALARFGSLETATVARKERKDGRWRRLLSKHRRVQQYATEYWNKTPESSLGRKALTFRLISLTLSKKRANGIDANN